jgi:hypothetical protein
VALALRSWLKKVLQAVDPWMSERDIQAGQIWFNEVADKLEASAFAVICITPENVTKPWLNFEAGAIGMARREGTHRLAAPYVLGLDELGVLPQPLGAFEAKKADKDGTLGLVKSINQTLSSPLEESDLEEIFEIWWPSWRWRSRPSRSPPTLRSRDKPSLEDLLEEAVGLLRSLTSGTIEVQPRGVIPTAARVVRWADQNWRAEMEGSLARSSVPLTVTDPSGRSVVIDFGDGRRPPGGETPPPPVPQDDERKEGHHS